MKILSPSIKEPADLLTDYRVRVSILRRRIQERLKELLPPPEEIFCFSLGKI
jgi:hypothetical protein